MEFVHPEILWGLTALAIPILVHLLQFRRFRRVVFPHVAFLQSVQRETRATQRLRHLLVLLARLIALAALVLAFAQPYTPPPTNTATGNAEDAGKADQRGMAVGIYIDNSFSMEAIGEEGQLLQSALERARQVIERHAETDRFVVLTHAFSGRDQQLLTRAQALERLGSIQPTPEVRLLPEVLARMENLLLREPDRKRVVYCFTDLQRNTHVLEEPPADGIGGWPLVFVPGVSQGGSNMWVDSVYFEAPLQLAGRPAVLHVRVGHTATERVDGLPLQLFIDGQRVALGAFDLVPGAVTDTVLQFTHGAPGFAAATVSLDDAPIRFDDAYAWGYEVTDRVRILLVEPGGNADAGGQRELARAMRRVFEVGGAGFDVASVGALDWEALADRDLVVVHGVKSPSSGLGVALRNFAEQGGTVLYLPVVDEDPALAAAFRTALGWGGAGAEWLEGEDRWATLRTEHPLYRDVFEAAPDQADLPTLFQVLRREPGPQEEVIATTERGVPLLSRLPVGSGAAYFFAASLLPEHANVIRHALFVPTLLRMAEQARTTPVYAGIIGVTADWAIPGAPVSPDATIPMVPADTSQAILLPEVRNLPGRLLLGMGAHPPAQGHYTVLSGTDTLAVLGMNNNRLESDARTHSIPEWEAQLQAQGWDQAVIWETDAQTIAARVAQLEKGTPWWKGLLWLALAALLTETLLLSRWKRPSSSAA